MITTDAEAQAFSHSSTALALIEFVREMGEAGARAARSSKKHVLGDAARPISVLFEKIRSAIELTPPAPFNQRYGNPAFRDFYSRLQELLLREMGSGGSARGRLLPVDDFSVDVSQLLPLLGNAFGNATRIDYGTGHELAAVCFFFCYSHKLRKVKPEAPLSPLDCFLLFRKYLDLSWIVIDRYRLEPAGSHGVWGLDDYQHVAFSLGARQLCCASEGDGSGDVEPPRLEPRDTLCPREEIDRIASHGGWLWFTCIGRVLQGKRGGAPLCEHSPILYEIATSIESWERVANGLDRMWQGEVLGKRPVVQHLPVELLHAILSIPK